MKTLLLIVVAVQVTKIVAKHHQEDILNTVKQINTKFSTETNVLFDFDDISAVDSTILRLGIPNVVLTRQVTFQFIYGLDKDILAIVYLTQNSKQAVQATLSHVLHRMHHVNTLFVLLDSTIPHSVFEWAWQNGFKNSVALSWSEGRLQLNEFEPFPSLSVVNLSSIHESSLQKKIRNFHGHPIRTPLANDPPRSIRYTDQSGRLVFSGFFFKLFHLFILRHNATIQEVTLPDPYPFGLNLHHLIDAVKAGKLDISLHPAYQQFDQFLCTDAFHLVNFFLIVPFAKPLPQSMYIVLPFHAWTWGAVTTSVFLLAIEINFAFRGATGRWEFGRAFLQALSGIVNISYPIKAHRTNALILSFVLLSVVGIMLSNLYLAHLSTFLTTLAFERQLNTFADVVGSPLSINIGKPDFEILRQTGAPREILEKVETVDVTTWMQHRRELNTSVIGVLGPDKFNFYAHQQIYLQRPRWKLITKPLVVIAPAFIMPFTSPYVNLYSEFVLWCIEGGIFVKFRRELNDDGIAFGLIEFIKPDEQEMALTLSHFRVSFILLGAGCALGMVGFVGEMVYVRCKGAFKMENK